MRKNAVATPADAGTKIVLFIKQFVGAQEVHSMNASSSQVQLRSAQRREHAHAGGYLLDEVDWGGGVRVNDQKKGRGGRTQDRTCKQRRASRERRNADRKTKKQLRVQTRLQPHHANKGCPFLSLERPFSKMVQSWLQKHVT